MVFCRYVGSFFSMLSVSVLAIFFFLLSLFVIFTTLWRRFCISFAVEIKKNIRTMYQKNVNSVPAAPAPVETQNVQYPENVKSGGDPPVNNDFENKLKGFFGSNFRIDDVNSQNDLLEHLSNNKEQNEQLARALDEDPRLAQMLMDVIGGKRNAHSALARYFGRSMMQLQEGTPEYEEMLMADDERRSEISRMASERREYEENLQKSKPVIEQFCNERGYDPADFMELVWERIVMPIMSGNYTQETCLALEHAINYEQDVEDAFAAGDIKGRNTNIQRMKENFGDGMPKGMSSAAPEVSPSPRRSNSLIDTALEA